MLARNSYLALLRHNRRYRFLWLGAVASFLGDWFNLIASADLIATLTDSGAAVSFLFLARFLPTFAFGPLAGMLADRFNRIHLMVVADLLRAVTVLGFLLVRDANHIWLFYTLTVVQFILSTLFIPAKSAVIPTLVRQKDLVTANTIDSLTWSTMLFLGALAGGIIAGAFGSDTAFILDALTFVLSAVLIARIGRADRRALDELPPTPAHASTVRPAFIDGVNYLRGVRFLLALSLVKAAGSLTWGALNVVEVPIAADVFPIGEGGAISLGIIYAASGLGTGLGPIVLRRRLGESLPALRRGIWLSFIFIPVGIALASVSPSLWIYCIGTFIRTVGSGTLWVFSSVMLQMTVPNRVRGRVFAFEFAALTLTQSISIVWAGLGQDWLGLSVWQVMQGMSVLGVGVFFWWNWIVRRMRQAGSEWLPAD